MIRTETSETTELGNGQFALNAWTGPKFYKETYSDTDLWLPIDETYSEPGVALNGEPCLVYPKLPNITRVFKDRLGYEIQSRSNPDHIARVELDRVNGIDVTRFENTDRDISAFTRVHPYRVGIWKQFKRTRLIPWVIRWKVTELGTSDRDSHPFAFRDKPEAFTQSDVSKLSLADLASSIVSITTDRQAVAGDNNSFYWYETIPRDVMLVDTDYQVRVGASARDCCVYYDGSTWQMAPLTNAMNVVGYEGAGAFKVGNGISFTGVTIPAGCTILGASMTLTCGVTNSSSGVKSKFTGHKVADSGIFTNIADFQGRRGTIVGGATDNYITTAQVAWDSLAAWTQDTEYTSPELKTVLQEMLPLTDGCTLFWDDFDNRSTAVDWTERAAYAFDGSAAKAPKLTVTWGGNWFLLSGRNQLQGISGING